MKRLKGLKVRTTPRGFGIVRFRDANGDACSLQESSIIAQEEHIWLGVVEPNPKIFNGDTPGWAPYKLPKSVLCTTRMHLSQSQVRRLLPLLKKFVETGSLRDIPTKGGLNETTG